MTERDDLDARLQAAFAPPPAEEFAAMARAVAQPAAPLAPPRRWWPWLTLAAALLLAVFLLMEGFGREETPSPEGAALGALWVAAHDDAVANGFTGSCCEPGFDMPAACQELFACRVEVRNGGPVTIVGSYCGDLDTGDCLTLLARFATRPVCVCVLPRDQDPGVVLPKGCSLVLTRRELGDLVLYALSQERSDAALEEFVLQQ